jgi:hypothetical protein
MIAETLELLDRMFAESPMMRADEVPDVAEIDAASEELGIPFSDDYREFLLRYGGAMIGPYPIFGLRAVDVMDDSRWSVVDVTRELRSSGLDGVKRWLVFSEDHSGNPIGMDGDGKVWIYDHNFGGVSELSSSFESYIRTQCLKARKRPGKGDILNTVRPEIC